MEPDKPVMSRAEAERIAESIQFKGTLPPDTDRELREIIAGEIEMGVLHRGYADPGPEKERSGLVMVEYYNRDKNGVIVGKVFDRYHADRASDFEIVPEPDGGFAVRFRDEALVPDTVMRDVHGYLGVRVSAEGNSKVPCPLINQVPVLTCPKGVPCAHRDHFCYAVGSIAKNMYDTCISTWFQNFHLWRMAPDYYFWSLRRWLANNEVRLDIRNVRFHSQGDIPDPEYLLGMICTAQEFPKIRFMAYTKQYDFAVDVLVQDMVELPENLLLRISMWPGWELPRELRKWPKAWVDLPHEDLSVERIPGPRVICPGKCGPCGWKCWHAKHHDVILHAHGPAFETWLAKHKKMEQVDPAWRDWVESHRAMKDEAKREAAKMEAAHRKYVERRKIEREARKARERGEFREGLKRRHKWRPLGGA